jgi:hypothetical protein
METLHLRLARSRSIPIKLTRRPEHNEIAATSKTSPAKNRVRGKKREADPASAWGRPKTLGKNQANALSGTAVAGAQASEERFAE